MLKSEHQRLDLSDTPRRAAATSAASPSKPSAGSKGAGVKIGVAAGMFLLAGLLLYRHYTAGNRPQAPPEAVSEAQVVAQRLADQQTPAPEESGTAPERGSGHRMIETGK